MYGENTPDGCMACAETLAVIPARMASSRLPGKPLLKLAGRELVLRVLDGVRSASSVDKVIVATDDARVVSAVREAGGEAMMTPDNLPTGSDRVAYVANKIKSRFVLNAQVDDPLVSGKMIDKMVSALKNSPDIGLAVLAKKIDRPDEITRSSIVKMVYDCNYNALYFSRSPIPFVRNKEARTKFFKHIGPYAWRRETLFEFASWKQTPLELAESLEMLRMLEHGRVVRCIPTCADSVEIDTQEDITLFEQYIM